jgi:hypothetical protein
METGNAKRQTTRTPLVSVDGATGTPVVETVRLHDTVHHVVDRYRGSDDWWGSPLETSLAAAGRAMHPPVFHEQAEAALKRIKRWWEEAASPATSADAAALALTARAAAALQSRDPELVSRAVDATETVLVRPTRSLPMLHAALSAWGLSSVVDDRASAPWPKLYGRLEAERVSGTDEALRQVALGLSRDAPSAAKDLISRLLGATADSPGLVDAAQLLWAYAATADFALPRVPPEDSGLALLLARRTELMLFLSASVTESTFFVPRVDDFDPEAERFTPTGPRLSSFDALLLDAAVAPHAEEKPWLREDEARSLFAAEVDQWRAKRNRQVRYTAAAVAGGAALTGAIVALVIYVLRVRGILFGSRFTNVTAGAAALSLCLVAAVRVWEEDESRTDSLREFLAFFLGAGVVLGLYTADHLHAEPKAKPLVTGTFALYLGLAGAAVLAFLVRLISKRKGP